MQHLIQRYKKNDRILSDVLELLFFETLNKPRPNDIADPILGKDIKIPYLNGGLFDKDSIDKKDIDFPYDYFADLMEFFSQYNFTIDENDPYDIEVGIDPEMLGHIFENLLEDNKDKGAFYTPKEIVQYMSRDSIIQYLKAHTKENIHNAIELLIINGKVSDDLQSKAAAKEVYGLIADNVSTKEIAYSNSQKQTINGQFLTNVVIATIKKDKNTLYRLTSFELVKKTVNNQRTSRTSDLIGTTENPLKSGNFYKIKVDKSGVFKITTKFLRDNGINPSSIIPKTFRIYGNGGLMLPELNQDFRYAALQENAIPSYR